MHERSCLDPYGIILARLTAGVAPGAEVLIYDVRFFAFPADGVHGTSQRTGSATGAGLRVDVVTDERAADLGRAAALDHVGHDLIAEVAQGREDRVGRAAAQRAERTLHHVIGQLLQ
jgi:hypothetical protein